MHRRRVTPVRPILVSSSPRRLSAALLLLLALPALVGSAGCGGGGVPLERITSEAAVERGTGLYVANCAVCHGQIGDGKGLRWEALITPPTDFTDPAWNAEATPERVFVSIRTGVAGTAMPPWPAFSDDETWDLVARVLAFDGSPGPNVVVDEAR